MGQEEAVASEKKKKGGGNLQTAEGEITKFGADLHRISKRLNTFFREITQEITVINTTFVCHSTKYM